MLYGKKRTALLLSLSVVLLKAHQMQLSLKSWKEVYIFNNLALSIHPNISSSTLSFNYTVTNSTFDASLNRIVKIFKFFNFNYYYYFFFHEQQQKMQLIMEKLKKNMQKCADNDLFHHNRSSSLTWWILT